MCPPSERPTAIDGVAASRLQLPSGPWTTVLDALCERFPAIARETWLQRMARGRVLEAQGAPLAPDAPFRVGADVYYYREVDDEPSIPFQARILYADEHLVVADKPHFLPVTPTGGCVRETLLSRLQVQLENPALVPLHRIDRDTAGLVLFSANTETRGRYHALFRERRIEKHYQALAPELPDLEFPCRRTTRLGRGTPFFRMQELTGEANAETRIDIIDRMSGYWRYALQPVTGRKHQLRVHMAALGAPILNDALYPVLRKRQANDFSRPLQLLAKSLQFVDPLDGRARRFESTLQLAVGTDAIR